MPDRDVKQIIINTPFIGPVTHTLWLCLTLPKQLSLLRQQTDTSSKLLAKDLQKLSDRTDQSSQEIQDLLTKKVVSVDEQLGDIKHRLLSINSSRETQEKSSQSQNSGLFADDHDLDDFYVKFENRFRGTEDDIKERLKTYLPILKKLKLNFSKEPLLDIGCGRGELLALLKENDIRAIGLDINETMVKECLDKGFEAVQSEALDYLMKQKTGSIGAITGFHIVEHIPFNFLLRLFEECHRVLTPGGVVIFETPNPENIHVGSLSFYYDPSHLHPLPPDVLAFAIENRGFEKVDILRLHPKGDGNENTGREDPYLSEIVSRFYMAQDYSVIGHKAG